MPKRYRSDRGALVALALILLAVFLVASFDALTRYYASKYESEARQAQIDRGHQGNPQQVIPSPRRFDPLEEGFAQWLMATFSVVAAGVSFWAVLKVSETLKATRKGNRINRRIGQAQTRAYVHVYRIKLTHADDGYAPVISVRYKNFGQSPARKLRTDLNVTFQLVGAARNKAAGRKDAGQSLGPGQDAVVSAPISFDGLVTREMLSRKLATLYVYGRIDYEDAFGGERFTKFNFRMYVSEADGLTDTDMFILVPEGNESN